MDGLEEGNKELRSRRVKSGDHSRKENNNQIKKIKNYWIILFILFIIRYDTVIDPVTKSVFWAMGLPGSKWPL